LTIADHLRDIASHDKPTLLTATRDGEDSQAAATTSCPPPLRNFDRTPASAPNDPPSTYTSPTTPRQAPCKTLPPRDAQPLSEDVDGARHEDH
jgi:hypothetical protein